MSRYLWKQHDSSSHTIEQACLVLDDGAGTFTFVETSSYSDWGDKVERTKTHRGRFVRRASDLECVSEHVVSALRSSDHELGTEEATRSESVATEPLRFAVTADGVVCPEALSAAKSASGRTMAASLDALFTLFPESPG